MQISHKSLIMKKFFYLSTCSTCKEIIKEIDPKGHGFEMQDVKFHPISEKDLELLHKLTGSYEALFSKRSQKYKELNLKDKPLMEKDYKELILSEYTFLKRPVLVDGKKIFIGKTKELLEAYK